MSIKRWLYQHGVRWHAQNLDRDGRGSMWKEGRAWLNVFAGDGETGHGYRELVEIHPEWHLGRPSHIGLGLEIGGGDSDREVKLHVGLPLATFWLHVDGLPRAWAHRILPGRPYSYTDHHGVTHHTKITEAREVRLDWHSNALWWSLWHSTMEWRSDTPRWRHGSFHPIDVLLGRHHYSHSALKTVETLIPMPEASYPATVTLQELTWSRPRWPFKVRRASAQIDIPGGIPVPGKGENSWDCGEDAILSMGADGHSLANAVAAVVKSATETRIRYGGADWRPAERQATA